MTNRKYLLGSIVWGLAGVLPLVVGCASVEPVEQSEEEVALDEEIAQALGTAVAGCDTGSDGYTTSGTVKTLTLSPASGAIVILSAEGGFIRANGRKCYDGGGTPTTALTTSNVTKIVVTGDGANDRVIIDQAGGSFGSTILGTTGGITLNLGAGTNSVAFRGTSGADTWKMVSEGTGAATDNKYVDLSGDGANADVKIVTSGTVSYSFLLGAGNDSFSASNTAVTKFANTTIGTMVAPNIAIAMIAGGAGNDSLTGGTSTDTIAGGAGNDRFTYALASGADGIDSLSGGAGTDTLDASAITGAMTVNYGTPTIAIDGGGATDVPVADWEVTLLGTANDAYTGVAGSTTDTTVSGGNGSDSITAGGGNDSLSGGEGNDFFIATTAALGNDVLVGGNGDDAADYADRTAVMTIDNDGSADDGLAGETDNVGSDIEIIYGGSAAAGDTITGGTGNDTIFGGEGTDSIVGGNGDDTLFPGAAGITRVLQNANAAADTHADTVDGGAGNDTIDFRNAAGTAGRALAIDANVCSGTVTSCASFATSGAKAANETDLYVNVEIVEGTSVADQMTSEHGTAASDADANVFFYGNAGDDTLTGGDGDDVLMGGAGADTLQGDAGDDLINTGDTDAAAADSVDGGAGDGDVCLDADEDGADNNSGTAGDNDTVASGSCEISM